MRRFLKIFGYIFLLWIVLLLRNEITNKITYHLEYQEGSINPPFSYYDVQGDYYTNVIAVLSDSGFTDISVIAENKTLYSRRLGEVIEISINGNTSFHDDDNFMPDSKVRITYYGQP